ncbi:MAG: PAS domain-containing protein [Calditrichaeota bacterium]|nr:PAS domain-containing protein [Calditrichota bacterium]MCB9391100.1 PAS domain-containing protein [Calditrichota bacterium]
MNEQTGQDAFKPSQDSAGNTVPTSESALRAELEALQNRLAELEDLEVQRLSEEQERFDSLNVLDEYAQQLEESRDKLARLLQAGVAIEEARTTQQILQNVANAVGSAGWASAVVYLFNNFEIAEAAFYGVCDDDRLELEKNPRPPSERAKMYSQEYDEFKISRSYFVPAERLHEVINSKYVVPGRREVMPGDDWNPLDLVYVPLYSSTGQVIGSVNCDDPVNGKRPTAEVIQYLEIFADLAARKIETVRLLNKQEEIEAKLRASEELYRTLFNRSADSFILMDDLFRECNEATLKMFNCEREDVINHSPVEFSPKYQPGGGRSDKLAAEYIERARKGAPQNFEWVHLSKDGTELSCEVSLASIDIGGQPKIMAIVRDVSERKRAARDKETAAIASQLFLSSRTPELVYSQLPKIMVSRFGVSASAIEIYDGASDEMVVVGEDGTGLPVGFRAPLSMTFSGTVLRSGEAIIDLQVGRRADYAHADLRRIGLQSVACVPLRVRDQTIGVIWLGDMRVLPNMSQFVMPLQVVANYLAQAIDRYRAEEDMADLKHFFESLLDNLPAQVCVYDRSGNYRYTNHSTIGDPWLSEWLIGRNDGEFCSRNGWHDSIGMQRMNALTQAITDRQLVRFEESLRDASDRERYYLRVMSPVEDSNGEIDHVIGYALDVTDTKLWEQEHSLLLQLPTENPFPVLSCSMDGRVDYMNAAASQLAAKVGVGSIESVLPTNHVETLRALNSESEPRLVRKVKIAGRNIHWTYYLTSNNRIHLYGVDMTSLAASESSELDMPSSTAQWVKHLTGIAWITDLRGRVHWQSGGAHSALQRESGVPLPELAGDEVWAQVISDRSVGTTSLIESHRSSRAWLWKVIRISDDQLLIQIEDQTEVRELQEKLRHAQRLESVGRLASGIAHDFNNLLTGIIGNLELLENLNENTQQEGDCIRDAARAAERASVLAKQLLNYGRKSAGEQRSIDPNAICESVSRMLSRTVDRRINVRTELARDAWDVIAEPNQLEQVLMNLGVNAADAILEKREGLADSGELYEIVLATGNVNRRLRSSDGLGTLTECLAISVTDNGSGMTPQIRARIFDAFFTTKPVQRGTGLGLSIVAEIVGSLGGEVDVQSAPGEGTVFTVFLPRSMESRYEDEGKKPVAHNVSLGGQETILMVDDEPVILELGREVLEQFGYTVITADDGQEAVDAFRQRRDQIDMVIMDLRLPRMNGEEVVALMLSEKPDIPVILSSGLPESESHYRNINLGSVAFIQKPYRPSELLAAVREVLDHAKS